MSAAAVVFLRSADGLAAWFTGGAGAQPDRAALTARLVRIVAFAQPPLALLMVLSGGLRGAGATRPPLVVNFLGLVAVRLPLTVVLAWPTGELAPLSTLGLGASFAMSADLTVRGLAMLAIFARLGWARTGVEPEAPVSPPHGDATLT